MDQLTLMAERIIKDCNSILKDKVYRSPNVEVVKVILKDFEEILQTMKNQNQMLFLNPKKELWSNRVIIDSANYSYDSELFDMVNAFIKIARCIPDDQILYCFNY